MLPIYFHLRVFSSRNYVHTQKEGEKWQVEQNVNNWWVCVKDVGEIVTLFLQFEIKSSENLAIKSYPPPHQIHLFSMCNISEQTRWKCHSLCSNTNPRIGFRVIRRQKGPAPNNTSICQWHMVCKIQMSLVLVIKNHRYFNCAKRMDGVLDA